MNRARCAAIAKTWTFLTISWFPEKRAHPRHSASAHAAAGSPYAPESAPRPERHGPVYPSARSDEARRIISTSLADKCLIHDHRDRSTPLQYGTRSNDYSGKTRDKTSRCCAMSAFSAPRSGAVINFLETPFHFHFARARSEGKLAHDIVGLWWHR